MILLHPRLAAIATIASTEQVRYALQAVKITAQGDTTRVEASDGKRMIRVDYKSPAAADFPQIPGFTPNGFKTALIPADEFSRIMKTSR